MSDNPDLENIDFENRIASLFIESAKNPEKIVKLRLLFDESEKRLMPSGRIERKDIRVSKKS